MGVRRARGSTLKPRPGTPINAAWAADWGLVAAYPFWTGGGIIAEDASGHGNPGALTNFASPQTATSGWGPGNDGIALAFGGDNDRVDITNESWFDFTDNFTIAMRVTPAVIGGTGGILSKYASDASRAYLLYFWSDNKFYWAVYENNSVTCNIGSTTTFAAGETYDLVVGKASGTAVLYVNGILEGSDASAAMTANNNVLQLGVWNAGTPVYFNGRMDYCYVGNHGPTPAQVMSLKMRPWQAWDRQPIVGKAAAAVAIPRHPATIFQIPALV